MHRTLATIVLLPLVACGPHIVAWPPPALSPGTLDPIPAGKIEVGGAGNVFMLGVMPVGNWYGSAFTGSLGVGVGHDIDVTLQGGQHQQGLTGGVTGVWWPVRHPKLDLGVGIGIAGSDAETSGTVKTDEVDEDGKPVERKVDWHYGTVAPSVTGRLVWHPHRTIGVPLALRASHSWSFMADPAYDLMPHEYWFEAMTGVLWTPEEHLTVGLGLGAMSTEDGLARGAFLPIASLSLTAQFGLPGHSE